MGKKNCWEYFDCEQQEKETCPAATDTSLNGKNGGINGGRICWKVKGTKSDKLYPNRAEKIMNCFYCEFFKFVQDSEGNDME